MSDELPTPQLICDDVLDISGVAELRAQLLAALELGESFCVDASAVERIDTAALQVFTAFFQDAASRQMSVQWQSPSAALCRAAGLLGLSSLLNLPDAAA